MERLFVYQMDYCRGLQQVSQVVLARFRLQLSHRRNHRSEQRLERAALLWAIAQLRARSSGDRNTNDTIDILGKVPSKVAKLCRPDKSVIWMLWASGRPQVAHGWYRLKPKAVQA